MRVTAMDATTPPRRNISPSSGRVQNAPVSFDALPGKLGKILSGLGKDDYILLGIIAVLIWEGCDDYILLAALGYLFFMGIR